MLKINLKKHSPIFLASLLLGGIFFAFLPPVQALQINDYPSFLNIREGMGFIELVSTIFNFLLLVAGLASFVVIVLGGVRYLTSAGDPSKMGDAKSQIFSAILGIIIIFSSWMVLNTINPHLVDLKEPDFSSSLGQPGFNPIRVPGTCAQGENYVIETYSDVNYGGDRKCFKSGEKEESYNGRIYSIKISGAAVKLFDEANLSGRNICFQGNVPDLHRCILAGAHDCAPGYAGWEKPGSLQTVGGCAEPGVTLSFDGRHIGEKCIFGDEIDIPACIYR